MAGSEEHSKQKPEKRNRIVPIPEGYVSKNEAAQALGRDAKTVERLSNRGKIRKRLIPVAGRRPMPVFALADITVLANTAAGGTSCPELGPVSEPQITLPVGVHKDGRRVYLRIYCDVPLTDRHIRLLVRAWNGSCDESRPADVWHGSVNRTAQDR